MVVSEGSQRSRYPGEYDVLSRYKTLNGIAEAIYDAEGNSNRSAQLDLRKIHHIKQDIAFYLKELLAKCKPDQIIGVLMQENLDQDIARVFGYSNERRLNRGPSVDHEKQLSERAIRNLRRFFSEDYQALTRLYCWGKIDSEVFVRAIQR